MTPYLCTVHMDACIRVTRIDSTRVRDRVTRIGDRGPRFSGRCVWVDGSGSCHSRGNELREALTRVPLIVTTQSEVTIIVTATMTGIVTCLRHLE